jgi:outer membrane lipoprotein-sorting protein
MLPFLAVLVAPIASPLASSDAKDITAYCQSNLKDVSFKAVIVKGAQAELRKINSDFGQAYKFDYANVKLKEPFMLRVESVVEDQSVLVISQGPRVKYRVPRANLNVVENLSGAPGRRQTFLDFGLLTPSLFEELFQAKFVRMDRATGDPVFDISYQPSSHYHDTSRHRVWIDPERHIVAKSEWYNQGGDLLATFYYAAPKRINGVWIATDLTVKNAEDKLAGETRYDNVAINAGLPNSDFAIN